MTIPEIFHSKGEIKFREIEKEYFRKIINAKRKDIISIGGGTPCYFENMQLHIKFIIQCFFYKYDC